MLRYTGELLGYAVALFVCYGVFVSSGFGWVGWSQLFLLLGVLAALSVIVLDSIWGDGRPTVIGVVLFCAVGFAIGWALHHYLLQAVIPAGVVRGETR